MSLGASLSVVFSTLGQWLYDWQTLISGVLALCAAIWAGYLLNKQVRQSERLAENERARKFLAARCRMPFLITEIATYCDLVSMNLATQLRPDLHKAVKKTWAERSFPPLPHEAIAQFTTAIEFSDDSCFIALVSNMIAELQVLSSRVVDIQPEDKMLIGGSASNAEIYLIQCAKISAMAFSLYRFARQKVDISPDIVPWSAAESALSQWQLDDGCFREMWLFVDRQKSKGPLFEFSNDR